MRDISLKIIAAAVLVAAGCSDHSGPDGGTDDAPPPTSQTVNVQDNQFVAATVRVASGGTVRWTWRGGSPHNVTFADGPTSATQSNGTFERSFETAGTHRYHCTVHGQSMSGTVTVVAPTQAASAVAGESP